MPLLPALLTAAAPGSTPFALFLASFIHGCLITNSAETLTGMQFMSPCPIILQLLCGSKKSAVVDGKLLFVDQKLLFYRWQSAIVDEQLIKDDQQLLFVDQQLLFYGWQAAFDDEHLMKDDQILLFVDQQLMKDGRQLKVVDEQLLIVDQLPSNVWGVS